MIEGFTTGWISKHQRRVTGSCYLYFNRNILQVWGSGIIFGNQINIIAGTCIRTGYGRTEAGSGSCNFKTTTGYQYNRIIIDSCSYLILIGGFRTVRYYDIIDVSNLIQLYNNIKLCIGFIADSRIGFNEFRWRFIDGGKFPCCRIGDSDKIIVCHIFKCPGIHKYIIFLVFVQIPNQIDSYICSGYDDFRFIYVYGLKFCII